MTGSRATSGQEQGHAHGAPRAWAPAAGVTVLAVVALAAVGNPGETVGVVASIVWAGRGFAAALVYALAAMGLGVVARPLVKEASHPLAIQVGVGLGMMLTLSHGLGALGALNPATAIGVCTLGLALLGAQAWRARGAVRASVHGVGWGVLCAVPVAVMIVAAAAPPGWLWASEYGQYDSLAYHLQLPQEWIRIGRITPLEHNVYSFLPSYIECAYVHLAHLTLAPVDAADGHGLLAGDAWRAQATHGLGVILTLAGAWMVWAFVGTVLARAGVDYARRRFGAWVSAALMLATPWVVVVGTISYNEAGVTALGGAAMVVAVQRDVRPVWRGALAGALVGVACGCKPTAMLFVTPVVGAVLVSHASARSWGVIAIGACVAGAACLAPWMVRNWLASGNPVFPHASAVFGAGHWTPEQVARYASAHRFDGGVLERVRLLIADDPDAPAGAAMVERFRGAANPQWGVLFPAGVVLGVVGWCSRGTRVGAAALLVGLGAQIAAWLVFTHLQSRFLLACALTVCPLAGIGVGCATAWPASDTRRRASALVLVIAQTVILVWVFAAQAGGRPNAKTVVGLTLDVARPFMPEHAGDAPWVSVNGEVPRGATVYLLGDAAAFLYERDVLYNSTYDAWPLGEAIRARPGEPSAWTRDLRERGVDAVLVSAGELARLHDSGWIDPDVTPERVDAWIRTLGVPIRVWERTGHALYALGPDDEGDASS